MSEAEKNFFRRRREELGKTQTQLASEIGVSYGAVQAWEFGNAAPKANLWDKVAAALKVSPERIAREILELARAGSAA